MDTADIATLNDALGSAGVDLRAEEESLQRPADAHHTYRAYEDRTRKQPPRPAFDTAVLSALMRTAATPHKVARVPDDAVAYLALALRARLTALVEAMAAAAQHRADAQLQRPAGLYAPDAPMWGVVVRRDVGKQLAALERAEREDEMRARKERKERAELAAAHAAALAAQAGGAAAPSASAGADGEGGDGEGTAKKKRKKDGPGVTARNMSEDVRKKMSNAVATQAAGLGGKYSWMTAANAGGPAVKPKAAAAASTTATPTAGATAAGTTATATTAGAATPAAPSPAPAATSTWARPYVSTKKPAGATAKDGAAGGAAAEDDSRTCITMRDALFVVAGERGHGGGRGAARGWV
ncbi:hypothetical protein HYPSUDRAFT_81205 [Hypholoma sublateritium FD-334 SS-4]|uniref:Transcription initiation factor TFIID subunit 4 n=1 Tax=Hypholoma sublateritium (strain FD-334 SS-4) TaxID=945553 RepID=A0A0D2LN73_HYPSF|nr:hypothetical protein HYPSUDRAFT_81205 [Hypholoma sublateritium FD-334 SS-4]